MEKFTIGTQDIGLEKKSHVGTTFHNIFDEKSNKATWLIERNIFVEILSTHSLKKITMV